MLPISMSSFGGTSFIVNLGFSWDHLGRRYSLYRRSIISHMQKRGSCLGYTGPAAVPYLVQRFGGS